MAGVKFDRFLLLAFSAVAVAFVVVTFWHSISRGGWSFVLGIGLFFLVPAALIVSVLIALIRRSKLLWYAVLINALSLGAFIPAMHLGNMIRDDMFLANLSTYQTITDTLISQRRLMDHDRVLPFPSGYWSALVRDNAFVEYDDVNQKSTVIYVTGDSFALGHCGYLYRSDDDEAAIKRERPDIGLFRLAPRWFEWAN